MAAVLALVHDAAVMLAFAAVFRVEIDAATIAAILTILGYSINDTIVIFDRVRENQTLMRESSLETILDTSVTQTLGRTFITSGATMMAVLALFLLTSGSMKNFGLLMIVGIIEGTYSTIFIASPIVLEWENAMTKRRKRRELEKYGVHDHAKPAPVEEPEPEEETDADEALEAPAVGTDSALTAAAAIEAGSRRRPHAAATAPRCRTVRDRARPGLAPPPSSAEAAPLGTCSSSAFPTSTGRGQGSRGVLADCPGVEPSSCSPATSRTSGVPRRPPRVVEPLLASGVRVLAVPGNMDRPDVLGWLEERGLSLHGRAVTIGGIGFFGLGGSNPTPFGTPFEVGDRDARRLLDAAWPGGRLRALPGARLPRAPARHPPRPRPGACCTSDRPWCGPSWSSHDVALCLCGHIHEAAGRRTRSAPPPA